MIKVFMLTMMFTTSNGGGGVTTSDFPVYDDCQESARAFVRNGKIGPITYVNAWCTAKHKPEEKKGE
jgi:hypothetical protein